MIQKRPSLCPKHLSGLIYSPSKFGNFRLEGRKWVVGVDFPWHNVWGDAGRHFGVGGKREGS